jgi:hypothetical protein
MALHRLSLSCAFMGLFAASAQAGSPQGFTLTPPDPEAIYGGTEVAECGWPTTVSMEGGCTGTLVHPQVVIYAGHCPGVNTVWMGERVNQPWRSLPVEFCRAYPGGQQGTDFAFCKLKAPVLDVPLVPILMGCETELLVPGQQVTIVGYGNADNGPYGIKREVTTTINGIQPTTRPSSAATARTAARATPAAPSTCRSTTAPGACSASPPTAVSAGRAATTR